MTAGWPELSCGSSPPLAALRTGVTVFDGDPHARNRPMGTIIEALIALGVPVAADGGRTPSSLPFAVEGTGQVRGGHLVIDASASSQFVSALLLVGARFVDGLHLEHVGKPVPPSLDHITMTVEVLRSVGVVVDDSVPNHWRVSPGPSVLLTSGSNRTSQMQDLSSPLRWPHAAPSASPPIGRPGPHKWATSGAPS